MTDSEDSAPVGRSPFPSPGRDPSAARGLGDWYIHGMDGHNRSSIRVGQHVSIVQKHHQATGELTEGIVERILTKSASHPHGIKVKLSSGEVGRVKVLHD